MNKISLAGVVAGIAILAAGLAGFLFFLFARLDAFSASLQRVSVPGEAVLQLQAGSHTVYWETTRLGDLWPGLECSVVSPDGVPVEVSSSWIPMRYSTGGRRGVSFYVFDAPVPGAYRFAARYPAGRAGAATTLAVRPSAWGGLILTVLGCLGILGGAIAVGVLLILFSVRTVRRAVAGAGGTTGFRRSG